MSRAGDSKEAENILSMMPKLSSNDVVYVLRRRFEIEKISKHFHIIDYCFKGDLIKADQDTSILIEYTNELGSHTDAPEELPYYRLLLLLNLREEVVYDDLLKVEIKNIKRKENVDRIIIWSCVELPPEKIQALKPLETDIISFDSIDISKLKSISHFIQSPRPDYDYAIALNTACDLLLRRLKKLFHLVLSEVAAPIYDTLYAKGQVATIEAMIFEEELLRELIERLKHRNQCNKAVDVGCGTGRHSFILAKDFNHVYAFDFSPKMIQQAEKRKRMQRLDNVFFSDADIEYDEVSDEKSFYGQSDLVVASFGMGSFIEDTAMMLRRFHSWLKDDGYVFLSFYNKKALVLEVTPSWRETSFSTQLDLENNTLQVNLDTKTAFHIFCKPYSDDVKGAIRGIFEVEKVCSFPTIMSLMPNSLLQDKLAKKLLAYVDRNLANDKKSSEDRDIDRRGYYVTVIAKKLPVLPSAYERIIHTLTEADIAYEIIQHEPVTSIADVREQIPEIGQGAVKTLIFRDRKRKTIVTVALLSEKRIDIRKFAEAINTRSSTFSFASEKTIMRLGFPLGGVAPFGFDASLASFDKPLEIRSYVDTAIFAINEQWLYMGVGDNTKTLKLRKEDFEKMVADQERISI